MTNQIALTAILFTSAMSLGYAQSTQAQSISPKIAQPGTIVSITGVGLDKAKVDEVFLTDHRFDLQVKVLEQTATTLKIRVPPFVKPGRQEIMFQTAGDAPRLLEQPIYLNILVPEPVTATAQNTVKPAAPPQTADRQ